VAVLDPEETHHLVRVLRLRVGARVAVADGQGRTWEAVVQALEPAGARLKVVQELAPWGESSLKLVLGIGLAKGDAMDQVIRQATEMGVQHLIPFISARSEKLTPERATRRRYRWQRLARESLKSCQRSFIPQIDLPQDFAETLAGSEEAKLLFWEEERGGGLKSCLDQPPPQSARLLIGPEGGFSAREVAQAQEAGFAVVSLGPRRLKVESAALAALTLVQYAWGDLA
jgi:16S rRNA (uracil1498-N3)-methyltransferase